MAPAGVRGRRTGRPRGRRGRAADYAVAVTAAARHATHGEWLAHARHVTTKTGVELWVVPDMPCDRPGLEAERVCLLPQDGSLLCDTPAALQRRGAWIHAGQVVAGFAPAGARWVEVRVEGSNNVTLIVVENGVFGAVLEGASPGARLDLRFS